MFPLSRAAAEARKRSNLKGDGWCRFSLLLFSYSDDSRHIKSIICYSFNDVTAKTTWRKRIVGEKQLFALKAWAQLSELTHNLKTICTMMTKRHEEAGCNCYFTESSNLGCFLELLSLWIDACPLLLLLVVVFFMQHKSYLCCIDRRSLAVNWAQHRQPLLGVRGDANQRTHQRTNDAKYRWLVISMTMDTAREGRS